MHNQQQQPKQDKNNDLLRYAGLGTQIMVALSLAVFVGYKADGWLQIPIPLLMWLLPLLVLIAIFYKLLKETSNRKKDK